MAELLRLSQPLNRSSYQDLPTTNGVYIFRKEDSYLYIGKSVNLKARVLSHVENAKFDAKENAIVSQATSIETVVTESEFNALLLESQLIQKYHPKYNVIWRDGKSHLYIKITAGPYPKIYPVRKEQEKGSLYFGPFSSTREVTYLLRAIRRVVPYCSQPRLTKKPCFYHKIHLCDPCPNSIHSLTDGQEKELLAREYRRHIRKIISILKGNTGGILDSLYRQLKNAIRKEEYEEGLLIRNKISAFEGLLHNRTFDGNGVFTYDQSEKNLNSLLAVVRAHFPLIRSLHRIECYDISNLMQKKATASMVVFIDGIADKSEYRRFKIKNERLQSDFDMLDETLVRRFANSWERPDLIVIDGGRPQIRRVMEVVSREHIQIPVIGIAKHPDRLVMGVPDMPVLRLRNDNPGMKLVQHARDESHRFARKYHLILRSKELLYNDHKT